jgi:DNA adenine methylase
VVSEGQYQWIKANPNPADPLTGFAMFGCSFGGKWAGGYARNSKGQDYTAGARNSLLRKLRDCRDLEIHSRDYRHLPDPPAGTLLYCDPPYEGTTGYKGVGAFDPAEFWSHALWWHQCGALVFVSEGAGANPPSDWVIYSEWAQTSLLDPNRAGRTRIERLYVHRFSPMGWATLRGTR